MKPYYKYFIVKHGERRQYKTLKEAIRDFFKTKAYKLEYCSIPEGKVHTVADVKILLQRGIGIPTIDELGRL